MNRLCLISGRSHRQLAKSVAQKLGKRLTPVEIKNFANGEIYVRIGRKVRGEDVFVIESMVEPVNENLMETLILVDALRRASVGKINLICPFLAYCRQDRKAVSREPITAKLVANLLTAAGVNRLVTIDLHADQIQGFYDIPLDHFVGYPQFAKYIKARRWRRVVVAAPDVGGVKRANKLADLLGVRLVIIDKVRREHNKAQVAHVVGEIRDKTVVILDDIVDTGGSVVEAAAVFKKRGAKRVIVAASHALLSGNARERLAASQVDEFVFLDTVPGLKEKRMIKKTKVLSIGPLLAKVIDRIHREKSLGELFVWEKKVRVL